MTALLAIVKAQGEAVAALAHGADTVAIVAGGGPKPERAEGAGIGRMIWPAPGDEASTVAREIGPLWLPLAEPWTAAIRTALDAGRCVVGCVEAGAGESALETAKRVGVTEVLVATPPFSGRRLLDASPVADLARVAQLCREAGLRYGFAGALEGPDVPRLLALDPGVIGFDTVLRDELDRFDEDRMGDLCDLLAERVHVPPTGHHLELNTWDDPLLPSRAKVDRAGGARRMRGEPAPATPSSAASRHVPPRGETGSASTLSDVRRIEQATTPSPDRIFVRDWTVAMSIGAYRRERGRPQRVRFTVEAAVEPAPQHGLAGTVSYDLIADAIARIAAGHVDLVEEVAEQLAALVLAHPRVLSLDITVEKLDVGPGSVGCRIVRMRPGL